MTDREIFIDYVKNGGKKQLCSPQIGCGAGYDAKIIGKRFCSEAGLEDTMAVNKRYNMLPLYNIGLDPLMHCTEIKWITDNFSKTSEKIEKTSHCKTPYGTMQRHYVEHPEKGGFNIINAINSADDLDMLEYVIDCGLSCSDFSCYAKLGADYNRLIGQDGALSFQWCMQPYEMLGYPDTVTTALLPYDDEPRFFRLMDKILELDFKIIDALALSGIDFVFLGGPGSEIISPAYYEKYLVPYSRLVTDYAHSRGLLIYSHICSPIEPMLSKGYYNQMGIDLFETISPTPEGNIKSLADALSKLDDQICTRGNVSLSKMLTGTPQSIKQEIFDIMDASRNRKHIVAASDYLLYDVPEANVSALCSAVADYNSRYESA